MSNDQNSSISTLYSEVKMPLMKLPVVSVVVRLKDRTILISPGSQLTEDQIKQIGPITDIVAPNLLHSGGVEKAKKLNPSATTWGVSGLEKHKPNIEWNQILTDASWSFQDELQMIPIFGMPKVREVVFFHRASKTLIVTDLVFNMKNVNGVGAFLIQSLFGTYRRFAMSRLFKMGVHDREKFISSLDNILSCDFDRIIMSHGEELKSEAKSKLIGALNERGFVSQNWIS